MSSKKSNSICGSSQYGSLDITSSKDSIKPPERVVIQPIISEPPKPAIRQRTQQQATNINRNDNLSYDEGAVQQVIPFMDSVEQNNEIGTNHNKQHQERDKKDQELHRELVELNKSLVESNSNMKGDNPGIKGTLTLPLPTESPQQERPYPKKVLFIIANEFCERFSYYGLRTVLVLYFKSVLGFSDATSTISFHLFAALCYLTPILGAILGDSVWGKFKTILYLSVVYFIGEFVLVLSTIFWDMGVISMGTTFIGLFMIGFGTGGIKPCVSALGGDQFLSHEDKWRQTFFSLFYGAINLGSLLSMFLTPMLRSEFHCVNRTDCYPYAFGLPCLLMFISIVVFLLAKNQYNLVALPEKNVIVAFCQCIWLAFRRKLTCHKLPNLPKNFRITQSLSDNTSNSSLSVSSNEDALVNDTNLNLSKLEPISVRTSCNRRIREIIDGEKRNHWLYLASDQFDTKSIEEFRSVLGIMLLFVPIPVYWCLYDQQSSLWTLQATRMDGRIFNTRFVIQPDQLSVANPLLLLAAIPLFEICIYPCLNNYNLLTKPIPRMTVGGFLAALTFVLSAMIELRIQEFLPPTEPQSGNANLLLVNGLNECSIVTPMISYVQIPGFEANNMSATNQTNFNHLLDVLKPLSSQSVNVLSENASFLNNYQFKFKLSNSIFDRDYQFDNITNKRVGCPFNPDIDHQFTIGPLIDKSVKLLYLEQGNGKLTYKMFNESLNLPPAGKARLRLLYEFFGSSAQAEKRQFSLVHLSSAELNPPSNSTSKLQFHAILRDGQVILSDYVDVDVSINGDIFVLQTNDNLIDSSSNHSIRIKPGTRNLIIAHQKDASNVDIRHELLQDNKYRISMLYQLGPYLLISVSEVMFSITGLEFSYSMAPNNMKSVILGAWSLTTAFGNILTVAVESLHIFSNIAQDFLFYAAIMALDIVVFAIIGYHFTPYRTHNTPN